jgi:hypothetical protein
MTKRWGVLGLVAAVVLVATSLTGCTPKPKVLFGIHSDVTYDVDNTRIASTLDAEHGINSQVVRTTLRWNIVEASEGTFDWSKPDYVVDQAQQRGMQVYFIVRDAPQWASGSTDPKVVPSDSTAFAAFVTRFKTFMGAAVQRYGTRVKYWEVWSEPNEDHYWQPLGLRPNHDKTKWINLYVQLYNKTLAYVQPLNKQAQIAPGALTGLTQSCCILGTEYLQALIDRGVKFKYLAINPHSGHNEAPWICNPGSRNFCDIQAMRDVLLKNNLSTVQMWVAEFGWQVGAYTIKGSTTSLLRIPGNQDRLALWPSSGQVVVAGQTVDYSSITKNATFSDITLASPLSSVPPIGTQISSPQAEFRQAAYVKGAYQMLLGTYVPAAGRPKQNYNYVRVAVYFDSFDKNAAYWGMYGLFRTPQPNYDTPLTWTLAPKPAAQAFSDLAAP